MVDRETRFARMREASARAAGESLEWLEREHPELSPPPGSGRRFWQKQHAYLVAHGCPAYTRSDGSVREAPRAFMTWAAHLRRYLAEREGAAPDRASHPRGTERK